MKTFLFILTIGLSTLFSGCADNKSYDSSERPSYDSSAQAVSLNSAMEFADFHGVSNSINADIKITRGPKQNVEIEAPQRTLDKMKIQVKDGILQISSKRNAGKMSKAYIDIVVPNFDFARVSGSGDMSINGFSGGEEVNLGVTGSGDIRFNGSADNLRASVTGSGDIFTEGQSNTGDIKITGSGGFKGDAFAMQSAQVRITGSGSAETNVSQEINGSITGSGSVYNQGDPKVRMKIIGSGKYRSK